MWKYLAIMVYRCVDRVLKNGGHPPSQSLDHKQCPLATRPMVYDNTCP